MFAASFRQWKAATVMLGTAALFDLGAWLFRRAVGLELFAGRLTHAG